MLADNTYTDARPTSPTLDRYICAEGRAPRKSPKIEQVETGLAPDLKIETAIPANPMLVEAIVRMHELKALAPNWDGYAARAVDARAFRPALALVIDAVQRCQRPTVVALADGGLGLRWDAPNKALEIDVAPNGTIEALCEGPAIGEAIEIEAGSNLEQAEGLLHRYCRA